MSRSRKIRMGLILVPVLTVLLAGAGSSADPGPGGGGNCLTLGGVLMPHARTICPPDPGPKPLIDKLVKEVEDRIPPR